MASVVRWFSCLFVILAIALSACGGGGGGGGSGSDYIGSALVWVRANPRQIDTGDRIQVDVDIQEVHDNGVLLKVRVPKGLQYVQDSSYLTVGRNKTNIAPGVNSTVENSTYLVYFLNRAQFGNDNSGTLTFEVEGTEVIKKGLIEIDPDVNDPLIDDTQEFDPNKPEFTADASVVVYVQ